MLIFWKIFIQLVILHKNNISNNFEQLFKQNKNLNIEIEKYHHKDNLILLFISFIFMVCI